MDKIVNLGRDFYAFVRPINKYIVMPVFQFSHIFCWKSWIGDCISYDFYSFAHFTTGIYELSEWCENEGIAS